jgi:amino acid transporter
MAWMAPLTATAGYLPLIVGYGNGLGAPYIFFLVGGIFALFAVGYLAMVRQVPRPGAFYTYVTAGLGKPLGLGAASLTVTFYLMATSSLYIFGGLQIASLFETEFGVDLPWWAYSLVLVVVVAFFSYRGIDFNARLLGAIVAIELVLVGIFDGVTTIRGGAAGHTAEPFTWHSFTSGSIAIGVLFALGIMGGFETAAIYREEVRDPSRTIPRATYTLITFMSIFSVVTTYCIIIALGTDNVVANAAADPTVTFRASAEAMVGGLFSRIVSVLLVTSTLACALASVNVSTRYVFNLGTDRVLPAMFGAVHKRHGSPHRASLVPGIAMAGIVIAVAASGMKPQQAFGVLGGVVQFAFEVVLILVSIAVIVYFRRNPDTGEPFWKVVIAPVLSVVIIAVLLFMGAQRAELLLGEPIPLTYVLFVILVGTFALGVGYAVWAARRKPDVYARIGRELG